MINDDWEFYGEAIWMGGALLASHVWWHYGCAIWAIWGAGIIIWIVVRAGIEGQREQSEQKRTARKDRAAVSGVPRRHRR